MIYILGAGMAGLLASKMLTSSGIENSVYEVKDKPVNNHGALLRFRSDIIEKVTGIPLRKVWVQKAVTNGWMNPSRSFATLEEQNGYAMRVTGNPCSRSISDLSPAYRYIAPDNFIDRLREGVKVKYGKTLPDHLLWSENQIKISTIPLPNMLVARAREYGEPHEGVHDSFTSQKIISVRVKIFMMDLHQTFYFPWESGNRMRPMPYRLSFVGDLAIVEYLSEEVTCHIDDLINQARTAIIHRFISNEVDGGGMNYSRILDRMSAVQVVKQEHGKINPIDDKTRKNDILRLTELHKIYSLGRFGTWRQILMDDVVQDVRVIQRLIGLGSYDRVRKSSDI